MNIENLLHFSTYLILYSFAGWVLESVSKTIAQRKFVNSGFLKGPFCPIYGFGAIIMLTCLSFLKENLVLLFIAAFFVLSIWEYCVGLFLEKVFKTKYWDYSSLKFNIHGRVALKNSIYWGVLGVIFICLIHPFVEKYVLLIPKDILLYSNIIIGIAMIVDVIISSINVSKFETTVGKLNELTDNIKEKLLELKELKLSAKAKTAEIEKSSIESVEKVIKELKIAQVKLKIRIYKQANRLKKAFPSMKSESITEFLSQKIDLKKLKKKIKNKE